MIEYSYNKKEDIIYMKRSQEIYFQDLIYFIIKIDAEFNHKKALFVIDDTRGSILKHDHKKDLENILVEIKDRINKYDVVKIAQVMGKPNDTAVGLIFELMSNEIQNFYTKVFSTLKAAQEWLLL